MTNKGIIALVIILVVIGGGIYLLTGSSAPTLMLPVDRTTSPNPASTAPPTTTEGGSTNPAASVCEHAAPPAGCAWSSETFPACDAHLICSGSDSASLPKICAQDLKQCSDGSYVGRTGSNCEFTACPSSSVYKPVTYNVSIQNFAFASSSMVLKKGDIIVWTNQDSAPHTVTGDSGGPNSATLSTGGTYSYTFGSIGTFAYHCKIHPMMKGTVTVRQ